MRSLSQALLDAHAGPVQRPAFLLEIGFATTIRLTNNAQVTFGGFTWASEGFDLSGITLDALRVTGSVKLPNHDNLYGAIALNDGTSNRTLKIWGYDAAATAAADFELLVDGLCGGAEIDEQWVTIGVRDASEYVYAPRKRVNAAAGFTYMLPAGATININGTTYRIERA